MSDAVLRTSRGNVALIPSDLQAVIAPLAVNEAEGRNGSVRVTVTLSLGELVMLLRGQPRPNGMTVDHIDRNPYNNTDDNLRWADKQTQNVNRTAQTTYAGKPTLSKYRGVTIINGRWKAQIRHNGVLRSKTCDTEVEAAEWYNQMALALRGEGALLNDI